VIAEGLDSKLRATRDMSQLMSDSLPVRIGRAVLRRMIPSGLQPQHYVERLIKSKGALVVQNGPFRGMQYIDEAFCSSLVPKWLGIYERELNTCIEEALTLGFRTVVDIGAAEGYYAVGFAYRAPEARIYAFEIDSAGRALLRKMVESNGVSSRVEIEERCTIARLEAILRGNSSTLVILLDPIRIPDLKFCHILVEVHDFMISGLSQDIHERFETSHQITQIRHEERDRSELPYRTLYTAVVPSAVDFALSERRPCGMTWYWMRPRTGQG